MQAVGGLLGKLRVGSGESDTDDTGSVEGGPRGESKGEISETSVGAQTFCSWATVDVVSREAPPEKEDTPIITPNSAKYDSPDVGR